MFVPAFPERDVASRHCRTLRARFAAMAARFQAAPAYLQDATRAPAAAIFLHAICLLPSTTDVGWLRRASSHYLSDCMNGCGQRGCHALGVGMVICCAFVGVTTAAKALKTCHPTAVACRLGASPSPHHGLVCGALPLSSNARAACCRAGAVCIVAFTIIWLLHYSWCFPAPCHYCRCRVQLTCTLTMWFLGFWTVRIIHGGLLAVPILP